MGNAKKRQTRTAELDVLVEPFGDADGARQSGGWQTGAGWGRDRRGAGAQFESPPYNWPAERAYGQKQQGMCHGSCI